MSDQQPSRAPQVQSSARALSRVIGKHLSLNKFRFISYARSAVWSLLVGMIFLQYYDLRLHEFRSQQQRNHPEPAWSPDPLSAIRELRTDELTREWADVRKRLDADADRIKVLEKQNDEFDRYLSRNGLWVGWGIIALIATQSGLDAWLNKQKINWPLAATVTLVIVLGLLAYMFAMYSLPFP